MGGKSAVFSRVATRVAGPNAAVNVQDMTRAYVE